MQETPTKMMPSERKSMALQFVRQRGLCGIGDLASLLDVSRVTVHRILNDLEKEGLVRKERGGVRIVDKLSPDGRFEQRMATDLKLKQEIARKAIDFIEEGDTIFLDASTTACCLAEALARFKPEIELTIVTNSLYALSRFQNAPNYHLTSTGGELDLKLNALIGSITVDTIAKLQISKAFISPSCVSLQGIMTPHSNNFEVFSTAIESAVETMMLAESPKFTRLSPLLIAPLSALSRIISDSKLSDDLRKKYEEAGVELV